jgi:hypothetical protein
MMKQVNLLWTAGWDSTFRLLVLVLEQHRPVQPYYIIDKKRQSTQSEIKAMSVIRNCIRERNPVLASLMKSTILFYASDIKQDLATTAKFERLRQKGWLGRQYDWLARFANQRGINDLELCVIHRDSYTFKLIHKHAALIEDRCDAYWIVNADDDEPVSLFSPFRFPLLTLSKLEIGNEAKRLGFYDILLKTWFCHAPKHGQPCGLCEACEITAKEGLGFRVPQAPRYRKIIAKIKRNFWEVKKGAKRVGKRRHMGSLSR